MRVSKTPKAWVPLYAKQGVAVTLFAGKKRNHENGGRPKPFGRFCFRESNREPFFGGGGGGGGEDDSYFEKHSLLQELCAEAVSASVWHLGERGWGLGFLKKSGSQKIPFSVSSCDFGITEIPDFPES